MVDKLGGKKRTKSEENKKKDIFFLDNGTNIEHIIYKPTRI
jgi:hypothetical protein